jgi:capsular exopolysaccharide synthesis family protein
VLSLQTEAGSDPGSDLREYIDVLRFRKWTVVIVTAIVVGSALGFSLRQTPIYVSQTRVLVRPPATAVGVAAAPVNLETERALVDSAAVASLVGQNMNLPESVDALLAPLDVSVETSTEILSIKYSDPEPLQAQRLADGFAAAYIQFRKLQADSQLKVQSTTVRNEINAVQTQIAVLEDQMQATTDTQRQNALSAERDSDIARLGILQQELENVHALATAQAGGQVVQAAVLPSSPSSPSYVRNVALAVVVGLSLGIGMAFLRERLDDRLRGREDFEEQIGAPVLATVGRVTGRRQKGQAALVTLSAPMSGPAEAYRSLRTNLHFIGRGGDFKVLCITSAVAGEGKTTTAANLAVAIANEGKKVIVVSCDLRKPLLHRFFGLENETGMSSILVGDTNPSEAIQRPKIPNLRVLTSGPTPPNPAELLGSARFDELLKLLRDSVDFVIVDTAPILAVTDALVIAAKTDGVLIVADAETTTRGAAAQTRQQLEQVGANIVGGILNNIRRSRATYYPNYYHEPDPYRRRKDERTDGRGKRSGSKDERPNVVSWE